MEKAKTIRPFSIKDAREVAAKYTSSMGDDFIALDDISLANLSNDTIRLGFFTYCFCTGGSAKFMIHTRAYRTASLGSRNSGRSCNISINIPSPI